jgi:hypothetical protein
MLLVLKIEEEATGKEKRQGIISPLGPTKVRQPHQPLASGLLTSRTERIHVCICMFGSTGV